MAICPQCQTPNPSNALFCIQCGFDFASMKRICPQCQLPQAVQATSCTNCNHSFLLQEDETFEKEFLGLFLKRIRKRVVEDHQASNIEEYLQLFYTSGFNKQLLETGRQLKQELFEQNELLGKTIEWDDQHHLMLETVEQQVDYFIIHFCEAINEIALSQSILKYDSTRSEKLDFPSLLNDFLQPEIAAYTIHSNLLNFSKMQIKNATTLYLFPATDERIFLMGDLSIRQNGKVGFAFTDKALYWKAQFQEAGILNYNNISLIEVKKDWLLLNGQFFSVSSSFNLRTVYLLRYLSRFFDK